MTVEWNLFTGQSIRNGNPNGFNGSVVETSTPQEWGIYSGYSRDNGNSNAIQPVGYERIREPGLAESVGRIITAKRLTRVPRGKEMSRVDEAQERLIDGINWAFRKVGVDTQVVTPVEENIGRTFRRINQAYIDILPEGVNTPTETDHKVDRETRSLIWRLERGSADEDFETTDDERKLASELKEQIGSVPPEVLRQKFVESVYGRANDIKSAENGNRLAYYQQQLSRNLQKLKHIGPNEWFPVDLLTNIVLLTKEERQQMQNIIWTVTPSNIHVRDIARVGEDFRRYPLADLARGSQGIFAFPATVGYVDRVRGIGGPLQPAVNRWAQNDVGGLVVLRTLGRDEPVAKFVVRDPEETAEKLQDGAIIAREFEDLNQMMTDAVRNPEAARQHPIRPNKVRELLPDPIVLQMGVIAYPDGTIDYGPSIRELGQRKQDLEVTLRALAIQAATQLDEEGNPPDYIQRGLDSLKGALERTESTENRVEEKQRINMAKLEAGSRKEE